MNSVAHNLLTPATCPHITGPDTVRAYKMHQKKTVASNTVNTKPKFAKKRDVAHPISSMCCQGGKPGEIGHNFGEPGEIGHNFWEPGEIGHGVAAVSPWTIGA